MKLVVTSKRSQGQGQESVTVAKLQHILSGGDNAIKLLPEDSEDIWTLYNTIRVGDHVTASTYRKVSVGSNNAVEKIRLTLCLLVESIDYEGGGQGEIRLKGRNTTENEYVKLGAYHTLEVAPGRAVTVRKADQWDKITLEKLREALDPAASADLAVVMITEGHAILCLVGTNCTLTKAKIETSLPKKKGAAAMTGYEKAIATFYSRVCAAIVQHVDWNTVKCLVIAGPGFAKDSLLSVIHTQSQREQDVGSKNLLLNKSKIVLASASTAYKHSIKEVLSSPEVAPRIKDTKAVQEARALEKFLTMLGSDPARAFYGPGHVIAAHELGAIDTLLISDSLFRTSDPVIRTKYTKLVEDVRGAGGTAFVLSAGHTSGQQLEQLSGLAAILRFPLPELEDMEFEGGY